MKATELRLGNWWDNKEGGQYIIDNETMMNFMNEALENNGEIDIDPIPLTEQWCKDFGFYKERTKDRLTIEAWSPGHPSQRFNIDFKDGKILLISRYQDSNDQLTMSHIKYVHTLQNLYFALTGEELTLKHNEK